MTPITHSSIPHPQTSIGDLPEEILEHILDRIDDSALPNLAGVNKSWQERVISYQKSKFYNKALTTFKQILDSTSAVHLLRNKSEILERLPKQEEVFGKLNSLFGVHLMNKLLSDEIANLRAYPHNFNAFNLSSTYFHVAQALAKKGCYDCILPLIGGMDSDKNKSSALEYLTYELLSQNQYFQAFKLAWHIPNLKTRYRAYYAILGPPAYYCYHVAQILLGLLQRIPFLSYLIYQLQKSYLLSVSYEVTWSIYLSSVSGELSIVIHRIFKATLKNTFF